MQQGTRSIVWTVLAAVALGGGTSTLVAADAWDVDFRKVRMVERHGLSAADPDVGLRIEQAHAVTGVDVHEDADGTWVVLSVSGTPEHRGIIYEERRRFVLDIFETLDVADGGPWTLSADGPIRGVRHSQYQVQPEYISRVVCDLAPNAQPEVLAEDGRLTIFVPSGAASADMKLAMAPDAPGLEGIQVDNLPALAPDAPAAQEAPPAEPAIEPVMADPAEAAAPALTIDDEETTLEQTPEEGAVSAAAAEPLPAVDITLPPAPVMAVAPDESVEPLMAVEADEPLDPVMEEAAHAPLIPEEAAAPVPAILPDASPEPAVIITQDEPVEPAIADEATAPVPVTAETVDEPIVEDLFGDEPEAPAEPARTEVDDTVDTPSMPILPEPAAPDLEPVLAPEPAVVDVMPEPVLDEPMAEEPMVDEPMVFEPPVMTEPEPATMAPPMPAPAMPRSGASGMDQTVTLTFRDADLNAVLDIIARKGRINVLAGRDVSGTVTVRLVDVPMDVALDAVLNVNGYGYIKTSNIYRIVPLSQIGGDEVETITEAFELSYAKADDVKSTLTDFLTRNGAINTDDRTNLLIVTDVPAAVQRIAELIPQIDRRVQQALIEVVILDSVLTDGADLGVQWNLFQADDRTPSAISPALGAPFESAAALTGAGAGVGTLLTSIQDGIGVALPSATSGGAGLRLRFGTLIGDFNLGAFVEAQVVNSDARVLANPKLLTLDNTTANIDIIQEIPFQDITQTSSGGQLSNISFKEVGTKLEVTPRITNDGYVILEITPEQSSAIGQTATGVPIVATRRANTTLLVQDHQTIVLGGLRVNTSNLTRTKVPGLGDVPGLRLFFRSTSTDESDTEILLFLTTHIVESPPVMPHERLVYEELANTPRRTDVQPLLWR